MEVVFNKQAGKYELKLPVEVVRDLKLFDAEGKPLRILHENKMSLDWIAADIGKRHIEVKELMWQASRRKKRKMVVFGILFVIGLAVALFKQQLSGLADMPVSVITILAIVMAALSGWAILQTILLGTLAGRAGLRDNLKTVELQEVLIKRFGK